MLLFGWRGVEKECQAIRKLLAHPNSVRDSLGSLRITPGQYQQGRYQQALDKLRIMSTSVSANDLDVSQPFSALMEE